MAHHISLKGGNMYLNRFLINEDAKFELSGVYYLKKPSEPYAYSTDESKGKEYFKLTIIDIGGFSMGFDSFVFNSIEKNILMSTSLILPSLKLLKAK